MTIKITYKNGNTLAERINYVHTENNKLYYTVDRNPTPVFDTIVSIPFENIEKFEVMPNE